MSTEISVISAPEYPQVSLGTRLAGEDLVRDVIRVARPGTPTRVVGTTAEVVVKNSPGYLQAIVVETAAASDQAITVRNATQTVHAIRVPANAPWTRYELNFWMDTDIRVQASSSSLTFVVVWA